MNLKLGKNVLTHITRINFLVLLVVKGHSKFVTKNENKTRFSRGQVKNNSQNTWDPLLSPSFIIMKEKDILNIDIFLIFSTIIISHGQSQKHYIQSNFLVTTKKFLKVKSSLFQTLNQRNTWQGIKGKWVFFGINTFINEKYWPNGPSSNYLK